MLQIEAKLLRKPDGVSVFEKFDDQPSGDSFLRLVIREQPLKEHRNPMAGNR